MPPNKRPAQPSGDVLKAFHDVVYDYGVEDMAAKIGMPTGSLYNKTNLNETSQARPSLGEAVLVQVVANDYRIVEAMAHVLGGVFMKLPQLDAVSDAALLEMVCEIHVRSGEFHDEIKESLANDGKFSSSEHGKISKKALHFITAVLDTVNRIEGMIDE